MSGPQVEICPRCKKPSPNVGPWSGEGGGHLRLCGGCKLEITMADPDRRRRLEEDIQAAFEATQPIEPGNGISQLLAPFAARGRQRRRIIDTFLLFLCLSFPAWAQTLRGPARVVDGDTLEVQGEKVRLHGIDAPELAQTCRRANGAPWHCGWTAAARLEELIGGRPVRCLGAERDRYGRVIARCYVVGERGPALDLGGALVIRGWAIAYRKYSADYNSAEATAKAARAGIWAGTFVQPEEWRRGGGR